MDKANRIWIAQAHGQTLRPAGLVPNEPAPTSNVTRFHHHHLTSPFHTNPANTSSFDHVDYGYYINGDLDATEDLGSDEISARLYYVFVVWVPIVVVLGTTGNILCVRVMHAPRFRRLSIGVYLSGVAVIDTIVLYTDWVFFKFVQILTGYNNWTPFDITCKLWVWTQMTFTGSCAWLIVALNIERFLVVCYPHKAKVMCTRTRALKVTSAILILNAIAFFHSVFTFTKTESGDCHYVGNSRRYIIMWHLCELLLCNVVPTLIMVIFNVLVIRSLYKRRSFIKNFICPEARSGTTPLGVVALLVTACYFILASPYTIGKVVGLHIRDEGVFVVDIVLYLLYYTCSATCFPLYCASGATFRDEISHVLKSLVSGESHCGARPGQPSCNCSRSFDQGRRQVSGDNVSMIDIKETVV